MKRYRFFVIDDSELDCYIAEKKIAHFAPQCEVLLFREADVVLERIKNGGLVSNEFSKTIILLDILMPLMNGYEFMDEYEKLNTDLKGKFLVIAITSSMYKKQIGQIYSYPSVRGVLEKPFTIEELEKFLSDEGMVITP